MSSEKKLPDNKDLFLDDISKLFRNAKPDPGDISESVDDIVLGHIKGKSREIRRKRNVVQFFPRWKQAAAAGIAVLVCAASINIFFRLDSSGSNALDIDGNGRINIIDAYLLDRRLMGGEDLPEKLDLNGDGYINDADIKIVADTSVALEKRDV